MNEVFSTPKQSVEFSIELRNYIKQRNILTAKTKNKVIKALETAEPELSGRQEYFRDKIIKEILESEKSYVEQIEKIITFFMVPVKKQNLLSKSEYSILFKNIENIHKINSELVAQLSNNSKNVGKCFSELAPFMKLYSMYAYDYKKSLKLLESLQNKKNVQKFIENQESRPEVQNKLSALLIAPIQRIPRYKLLISQLLEHTPAWNEDFNFLKGCLSKIEETMSHVDHLLKTQENAQKMLELQKKLFKKSPAIIKPGRLLVKEGFLKKMSMKKNRGTLYYVILFNDMIMLCRPLKNSVESSNSLRCIDIYPLNKCKTEEIASAGIIKLIHQYQESYFYCESSSECHDWVDTLNESIKEYTKNRKTLRKKSSSKIPIKKLNRLDSFMNIRSILKGDEPLEPEIKDGGRKRDKRLRNSSLISMSDIENESPLKRGRLDSLLEETSVNEDVITCSELSPSALNISNKNGFPKLFDAIISVKNSIANLFNFRQQKNH